MPRWSVSVEEGTQLTPESEFCELIDKRIFNGRFTNFFGFSSITRPESGSPSPKSAMASSRADVRSDFLETINCLTESRSVRSNLSSGS